MSDAVLRININRMIFLSLVTVLISVHLSGDYASAAIGRGAVVEDPAKIYESRCAMCHGRDGRGSQFGKSKGVPDFTDSAWQKSRTDRQLIDSVTDGKNGKMPAWKSRLSVAEISALVGRVREFKK